MAPLIPQLAGSMPAGLENGFWTVQALVNGYAGLKFIQWKSKN